MSGKYTQRKESREGEGFVEKKVRKVQKKVSNSDLKIEYLQVAALEESVDEVLPDTWGPVAS